MNTVTIEWFVHQTKRIRPTSLLVQSVGSPSTNKIFDSLDKAAVGAGAEKFSTFFKEAGLSFTISGGPGSMPTP